jgi:heme-binding NEAT domain protein
MQKLMKNTFIAKMLAKRREGPSPDSSTSPKNSPKNSQEGPSSPSSPLSPTKSEKHNKQSLMSRLGHKAKVYGAQDEVSNILPLLPFHKK